MSTDAEQAPALRPYQREAVEAYHFYYQHGGIGNGLIVLPTGSGKSHVIAEIAQNELHRGKNHRVVILSHRKEILRQNGLKIIKAWPDAPLAFYSAGLNQKRISRLTIAGIQSIWRRPQLLGEPTLCLIDEAHLVPHKDNGMYRAVIRALKEQNPDIRFVGFTATAYRLDSGVLFDGDNALFTDVLYDAPMRKLVDQGYLTRLVSKNSVTQADLSSVRISGKEYNQDDLEHAFDDDLLTTSALNEICYYGANRKRWLIFASSVAHVWKLVDAFRARGLPVSGVTGEQFEMERDKALADFEAGRVQVLVNCEICTIGVDVPSIDLIALLRATKSASLYVQMCGRGSRLFPGKKDCLVLDYGSNILTHGPVDSIRVTRRKDGKAVIERELTKTCPECRTSLYLACRVCSECGHEFGEDSCLNHDAVASDLPVMYEIQPPELCPVQETFYKLHDKKGRPPSMRVVYRLGITREVSEWVCFEHKTRGAKSRAKRWWAKNGGQEPVPETTEEALSRTAELKKVAEVYVQNDGQFERVKSVNFMTEEMQAEKMKLFEEMLELGLA